MGELEDTSSPLLTASTASGEASLSSSAQQTAEPPAKKKRNLPGMPDPDAEVIALSPTTLMATNRFVCEICSKGFQRDQNLQLHRRGHNLPWKLRQRPTGKEVRKRVYICPETTCVHHNPTRALGDLTGIKKHFCRKHGEKKWKCERCAKKYAVQSDWKAHMKTCGTREYKCDCGTLFSRRDSFITHRAFCDALAEESAKNQTLGISLDGNLNPHPHPNPNPNFNPNPNVNGVVASPPPPPLTPSNTVVSPALSIQSSELLENPTPASACLTTGATATATTSNGCSVFASIFAPSTAAGMIPQPPSASSSTTAMSAVPSINEPTSLSLSTSLYLSSNGSSLFPAPDRQDHHHYAHPAAMSATALLQKAAQMGAAASNASLLRGFGVCTSSSPRPQENSPVLQWCKSESDGGLGLELLSTTSAAHFDLGMGPPAPFGAQPMTRDLLGLSIGGGNGGTPTGSLSALLNSLDGDDGFGIAAASAASYGGGDNGGGGGSHREVWEGEEDIKPNGPALH